ncbi:16S rRNA (adenine(1518)-N(6)/adenine(1519)-N(6))-dimethyltransferase RsmA [Arcicella sp. LKC2W]|uniref:16S rRNA (adenine(1518)-N(6)/adenine(1519)-N(6))- dimethyltransferase RsmA n=1 Tax=Arcicella sp. LKC2W TaxID=2984198 RepID=UPI002B1F82F8|nr:16S rRNA (adenine(1518)-N(6)/adenine(1519)-N(6))-dimethyltransferase RsmA [Arcicella sp. LKC2W]MEA5459808.1 16S rRNA (adenine(1518)-N(6)/adenine(1519)-N(6))-dimethyltransferase RsmA [Arcicella sp. LKC2W]
MDVRAKKSLGQHFLRDLEAAKKIADLMSRHGDYNRVLEIGPGMGVLTQYLLEHTEYQTDVVELDRESVDYLNIHYPQLKGRVHSADFLHLNLANFFNGEKFGIVGNFPYNISSQILFKVLDYKDLVPEVAGMFQKEVAVRIASKPGNKDYGILSVLLQAFYDIEYCFSLGPEVFSPPPKVNSGVIRLKRNNVTDLGVSESLFKSVVKMGFNQRRKTLRNALKALQLPDNPFMSKRAEQLSVADFLELTQMAKQQGDVKEIEIIKED